MTDPREILTRPAPPPDLTVRYGEHPDHVIDVRLPPAEVEPRPLVVFIHGGFWRSSIDRGYGRSLAADLAGRGHPVASIEFRRAGQPGGGWPGTFDDVRAALSSLPDLLAGTGPWARVRGPSTLTTSNSRTFPETAPTQAGHQVSPTVPTQVRRELPAAVPVRAIVVGHSSGGHLALWLAAAGETSPLSITGVLALAPVCDLVAAFQQGIGEHAVASLLGDPGEHPERFRAVDPIALPAPAMPTVIVHGDADQRVPVSQSRDYAAVHPQVRLDELAGVDHFAPVDPQSAAWPAVLAALAALAD